MSSEDNSVIDLTEDPVEVVSVHSSVAGSPRDEAENGIPLVDGYQSSEYNTASAQSSSQHTSSEDSRSGNLSYLVYRGPLVLNFLKNRLMVVIFFARAYRGWSSGGNQSSE
ncbi:hypothetical protein FOZ63_034039 [Perkinsus olseni]|uniref:Uncharacterized protein n=1 Tax=Perkinsus olseni TaxID=32597 RepID=A0A7J6N4R4_PEROL|nr:hypothetical protein FOZ60_015901 [Perkinsus olseni]KAF4691008.1 hypothetical protein FOZ62_027785 [Perkinsus olseni]KAF4757914.1 hypothetical protein FOZ63_034039 [Perkinsus olseni]